MKKTKTKTKKRSIDEMVENQNDAPHQKHLRKYFKIKITQSKTKTLHLIFKKKFGIFRQKKKLKIFMFGHNLYIIFII